MIYIKKENQILEKKFNFLIVLYYPNLYSGM